MSASQRFPLLAWNPNMADGMVARLRDVSENALYYFGQNLG